MRTYIQINPADNVVVAVKNLQTGASLDINGRTIVVLQDIPAGHKVALQDFKEGDHIIKYGAPIGHAREVITTGSWVNEKNIKTNLEGLREYEFNPQPIPEQPRDMVLHPNAGAVLVVGLGCENNQVGAFREMLGNYDTERIRFMETQKVDDELETGMELLRKLYAIASQDKRTDIPLSELRVGLKCGGSDGFSGITANPLLGVFSDFLVAQGGTTVLTEVPEMFGAETILMNRSESKAVFEKTVHLINDFKSYFIENKQPIYENPSPGNKAGGISTLEEKSLGCTQKAGTSAVRDVMLYGERLKTKGLNLLSAPGNDLVASTALASSGCHLVLFTTGRGTPFGTFVPTVKVSTNSNLNARKPNWIDFNAGSLLEGESMEELRERFIRFIIGIASGNPTNNEKNDYREIAIFKSGVTL